MIQPSPSERLRGLQMVARVLRRVRVTRETVLDWACVLLAAALLLLAATALNRLPYPGRQPYAHHISAVVTSPLLPGVADRVPEPSSGLYEAAAHTE